MKYNLYTSLLLIFLFSINSFSQELDEAFLSSLPEDIASDLKNRSFERNTLEETQYRRPSTFIEKPEPTSDRFGAQIFSMMQSTFMPLNEPNFDSSYILDFGDELKLQLIGQKSKIDTILINRDGSINIEDIGKLFIAGMTLNDATNLIKAKINQSFIGVEAYVTLTNVRDIQIIMAGNVYNPGPYTLNGNSNIFHALSISGGPSEFGSFRSIDLIRDDAKIETIDLYETFIFGKPSFNTRLRSGDIVFVNIVKNITTIRGGVKRPGSYELKNDENLSKLIEFSNGLNAYADLNGIRLERILDGQIKPINITNISQFNNILVKSGDSINIREFPFRSIEIRGAVENPGVYSMNIGDTINDVLVKAGGYSESAYPFGAVYERKEAERINSEALKRLYNDSLDSILQLIKTTGSDADFAPLISILSQIKDSEPSGRVVINLEDKSESNLILIKDQDIITIPEKTNQVYIFGAVSSTGAAQYQPNKSANHYINRMGGIKENADQNGIYILYPNGETVKLGMNRNIFASQARKVEIYPGSVIYVPEDLDSGYAARLAATAYASILGNIGVSLASLSVLKDWCFIIILRVNSFYIRKGYLNKELIN